jgi:hypothetical protein
MQFDRKIMCDPQAGITQIRAVIMDNISRDDGQ